MEEDEIYARSPSPILFYSIANFDANQESSSHIEHEDDDQRSNLIVDLPKQRPSVVDIKSTSSGNVCVSLFSSGDFEGRGASSNTCKEEKTHFVPNFYSEFPQSEDEGKSKLKGILKRRGKYSSNERAVGNSLNLLCSALQQSTLREHARTVFNGLCLDEFFVKGECIDSKCDQSHHYRALVFNQNVASVWNAALFVICHAPYPDVRAIKCLVHFFSEKRDVAKTLALSKCIAKVKDVEKLDLANFIVNRMTGFLARRDVITQLLFLNFPELSADDFNLLVEGLGVYEHNTAHFSDLMNFLHFQGHKIPGRLLLKMMADALHCCSLESSFPHSVAGLLDQLSPDECDKLQPTLNEFLNKFGLKEGDKCTKGVSEKIRSASEKKRVKFNLDNNTQKFIISDESGVDETVVDFSEMYSDSDEILQHPPEIQSSPNDTLNNDPPVLLQSLAEKRHASLVSVFGNTCRAWIVHGDCPKIVCSLSHCLSNNSLKDKSPNDVFVASDFIVEQTIRPDMEVLKPFVIFLASSDEISRVLSFRKCVPRMSLKGGLSLTQLVLSQLCLVKEPWEALEIVLIPNLLVHGESNHREQFPFDGALLESVMTKAVEQKNTISRQLIDEIMRRLMLLPASEHAAILEAVTAFIEKFVLCKKKQSVIPDIIPVPDFKASEFSSQLKVALYNGAPSKFFVGCTLLKFALEQKLNDIATDDLYAFLLGQFARARVLDDMLETCIYFSRSHRKALKNLLGNVALRLSVHFYENENHESAAEIMLVLQKYQLNILALDSQTSISRFNLAMMYCLVVMDSSHSETTIDAFFEHCLQPFLDTAASLARVPKELIRLMDKMFAVLSKSCATQELLNLFNGILSRQNSLVCPLNIVDYFEVTLRCTFLFPCDPKGRYASLKLYLDVAEMGVPIALQKVTLRSVFIFAGTEILSQHHLDRLKGWPNYFHPLMKKILMKCLAEDVYPKITTGDHITLLSSMTSEEIKIYLFWWFGLFLRAKKRRGVDYYYRVTVNIVQDCIQDELRLPIHFSLQKVDPSEACCALRLSSFIKSIIDEPLAPSMFKHVKRGTYELCPNVMRAISHAVIRVMIQYNLIESDTKRLCSFCYDKKGEVVLASQI